MEGIDMTLLPLLEREGTKLSCGSRPYSRRSSIILPSISDSTMYGSEGLDSVTNYTESEYGGFSGVSSEFDIVEEDERDWPRGEETAVTSLEESEEKEIEDRVKQEFKQEFQKIRAQAQEKQTFIRKKFKSKINKARAALLTARINAEKETINKLEKDAQKKEADVLAKRWKRKVLTTTERPRLVNPEDLTCNVNDLAALRKIRSDLDRARARRRSTIASTIVASRHGKMSLNTGIWEAEVKRLEKVEEIQKLIYELQSLGLRENANTLITSLCQKRSSEEELKASLIDERRKAKMKALEKKEQEIAKLRQQKLAEKELEEKLKQQREREEKERLEKEKREKIMLALKRKAFNQSLRKSWEESKFTTRLSRPYTYSYFDVPKQF